MTPCTPDREGWRELEELRRQLRREFVALLVRNLAWAILGGFGVLAFFLAVFVLVEKL